MIDNNIGVEGVQSLCEMLNINTTLKWLDLWGKGDSKGKKRQEINVLNGW